jgi:hypothetical protein
MVRLGTQKGSKRMSGRNAIILTSGLTGSSVLTGLISQAGYWTGDSSHKKEDYDTYENQELIDLNLRLFEEAGYKGNYMTEFSPELLSQIGALYGRIDSRPYQLFLDKCNKHQPWIWKDPRLWLTIHFWKNLLHLDDCTFILLTRDYLQAWISATLRRQIRSYSSFKNYEWRIKDSVVQLLEEHRRPYLHIRYDELIAHPAATIDALNRYLETSLSIDDLKRIYRRPLFRSPRASSLDYCKAVLIYMKNYSERVS